MNDLLWIAFGLFLVFEGLLPALHPALYRRMISLISQGDDRRIRIIGVIMMVLGTVIIYFVKS